MLGHLDGIEGIEFYTYLCDEPNTAAAYAYVRELGTTIKSAGLARIKVLVVEQTTPDNPDWGTLYGAVDIWVPTFRAFDPVAAAARQAMGETIWTYTALTEWGGGLSWQTDLPLINYRIPPWIAWRYEIKGLLYWSMAFWFGPAYPDPWNKPHTYTNHWQGNTYFYNGEGVLVYPADTVGYEGIASSLRLKAIRDGIEDYEYLVILENLTSREYVAHLLDTVVTSFDEYSTSLDAYLHVRDTLAAAIESRQ